MKNEIWKWSGCQERIDHPVWQPVDSSRAPQVSLAQMKNPLIQDPLVNYFDTNPDRISCNIKTIYRSLP